ncbi:MAG: hypothetical protein WBG42_05670 [Cryomorphaceae bacterium]
MKFSAGASLLFFLSLIPFASSGQSDLFTRLNFRTTGTYIADWRREQDLRFHKTIWNTQVATSLTKSLYIGVQASVIFTSGNTIESANYTAWGPFVQYDFVPQKDFRVYLESNYSWGDFCPCAEMSENYYRRDVNYFGIGLGFDKHVADSKFFYTISVIFQEVLEKIPEESGFNYYRLGIGYDFGKK